jgi:hypothetical protein
MQPAQVSLWLCPQDGSVAEEREVVRPAAGPEGDDHRATDSDESAATP